MNVGYRQVDTARIYGNARPDVGGGIRRSAVAREEVFVTTELWNQDEGYDETLQAFDTSLARLGLDYIDLYLIHWPVGSAPRSRGECFARDSDTERRTICDDG